jgi:flagellar assembly protein FliH
LFKPEAHQPAARHWLHDTWLHSSDKLAAQFGEVDWAQVPKLDYASVLFKQLATPEPAKVHDNSDGFVLETFGLPLPTPRSEKKSELLAKVLASEQSTASLAKVEPAKAPSDLSVLYGEESFWTSANPDVWDMFTDDGVADQGFNSADWAAAREVAYQEGFAAGREEGHQVGYDEGQESGKIEGLAEGQMVGYEAAQSQADAAQEQALEAQKVEIFSSLDEQKMLLKEVTDKLQALSDNPKAMFEPLKRLALHISEHMVLAELNLSGQAIERLVQRCLDELDLHGQGLVTIELNPQDKVRLEEKAGDMLKNIQLHGLAQLKPGSVRVLANDTQVEDLVQTRLQALANSLLGQPEAWREQSSFFKQPLSQRDTEVTDASPREVVDPRQVVDARHLGDIEHG